MLHILSNSTFVELEYIGNNEIKSDQPTQLLTQGQ